MVNRLYQQKWMSELDADLYDHIQAIARRVSCNDDAYMDLAHDAVVKVMETRDSWNGTGTFKAWASIVAANHIIDLLRRNGKRPDIESQWTDQYATDKDRLQRWLASDRAMPLPIDEVDVV